MNKEIEEAIKYLKLIRKNHDLEKKGYVYTEECIDTVLNYIDNSIPKEVIEEKIEEINKRIEKYREYTELGIETDIEWVDNVADRQVVQALQELLEGK